MRGRSLNDSFIIPRRGAEHHWRTDEDVPHAPWFGSKIVVTGDTSQIDLPGGAESGLHAATRILEGIDDIHFSRLTSADVVRHRLVANIVDAYDRDENSGGGTRAQRRSGGRERR